MINTDLAAYIVAQRAQGITDADISTALIGRGWNANDVRAALAAPSAMLAPSAPLPGISALLSDAFTLFRRRFMLLFLVFVPSAVVSIAIGFVSPPFSTMSGGMSPVYDPSLLLILFIGAILNILLYFLSSIAAVLAIMDETITSPVVAWQRALPILPRYFVTALGVGLWIFYGFLLLVIPGIIFSVQYTFSALISIIEGKKVTEAMDQSKSYVKGRWGAIALRLFGGTIVVVVANILLSLVMTPLLFVPGGGHIAKAISSVASIVFSGFISVYLYTLYIRVKGS